MVTGYLDPDSDNSPTAWTPSVGATHFGVIDGGARDPDAPTTDNIFVGDGDENAQGTVNMEIAGISNIDECSSIEIHVYGNNTSGEIPYVRIYTTAGWEANQSLDMASGYAWFSRTFTANQPYSQADIESLVVRFTADSAYGKYDGTWIRECYAEITYSEVAGGWGHKMMGVVGASIGKISGVAIASIGEVKGVAI